jgi:hypothetical protein
LLFGTERGCTLMDTLEDNGEPPRAFRDYGFPTSGLPTIRPEFLFPRKGLQRETWGKKLYAGLLHASLHQSLEGRASLGDVRETGVRALEM